MVPGLCTQAHAVDQRQDKNPYNATILELEGVTVDWRQDQNPCNITILELEGVTCNNERVFKLIIMGFGLDRTIFPFILNCTNLDSLDLLSNCLIGEIPMKLQYMVNAI